MIKRDGESGFDKKEKGNALVKKSDSKLDKTEKARRASRVRFALEQEPKVDMYFYKIYRKLRLLRYVCVLLAALFVMTVPMVYSDHITTDNFKYLMKYINLQLSEDAEEYAPFSYEPSECMDFGIYSDDIVICTDSSVVFYDKLGNESLRVTFGPYEDPTMLISKAYVMVYDRGGNEYVILNNFKLLHRKTTEYPILHCALDDSGRYAVLTSNQNYSSEVQVFNRHFKQTNRIQRDLYISDLFFTDDVGGFGYTGFTTDTKGGKRGEVCLYDAESQKILEVCEGELPLRAVALAGRLKVLYTDRVTWYDMKGKELKRYTFNDAPGAFYLSGENTVICFEAEDGPSEFYTVLLSEKEDEPIRMENTDRILRVQWHEDRCYLIGEHTLAVMNGKVLSDSIADLTGLKKLLFLPGGKLMGCYSDRTETIVISESQTNLNQN
ncbi:MAG: hypothetical protein E7599_01580 [Ruminococcaceae bacterium]|nr:hypothetical protein [Oscillospiraceae bacterium]